MAKTERVDGKTPSGGDYSEILYFNDAMEPVDGEVATRCVIRECRSDGTPIMETVGQCERKGPQRPAPV